MTLLFIGDAEPSNTSELIKDFNASVTLSPSGNINALILMGDMTTSSGTMPTTISALNGSSLKNVPTYFVIGNHEYDSRSKTMPIIKTELGTAYPLSKYSGDKTGNTFSFNDGDIHVVILNEYYNNSTGKVDTSMFNWLSADLKASTKPYKVVVGHDPMYPLGRHEGNSLDADKKMRDNMQKLLVDNDVNIFIGGHVHISSTQTVGGVLHVCTGVIGPGAGGSGDDFATINYVHVDSQGRLVFTAKQDKSNSWSNPKVITKIISGDITPIKRYKCINNSCEEDASGNYTDSNCNNECSSSKRYKCSNNECVESSTGPYTSSNCNNECSSIDKPLTKIDIEGCAAQPKQIGDTCTMTPICYSNGLEIICPIPLIWKSNDPSIVSVKESNGKGKATAIDIGSCNITAKYGNITSESVPFTVVEGKQGSGSGIILLGLATAAGYYYFKMKNKPNV